MIAAMPKNVWYVAAWSDELSSSRLLDRTIMGQRLVLYRTADGAVAALQDRCPHRAAPLAKAIREGDNLRCGYHGMLFSADGRCLAVPGQSKIPPSAVVPAYPAVDRHGWIWVWMGEPALADAASIPPVIAPRDPGWRMRTGYIHYRANIHLLNDNLLDFSHLEFVHRASFGGGAPWSSKPEVRWIGNSLHIERWLENVPVPPIFRAVWPGGLNMDLLNSYDFIVPGILIIDTKIQDTGTATREALSVEGGFRNLSCQAVTPETDNTSHYFFSIGVPTGTSDTVLETLSRGTLAAFEEDRAIMEAQQALLAQEPDEPLSRAALAGDGPLVRMRKLLSNLARSEAAARRE